jgi:hypothetical protein
MRFLIAASLIMALGVPPSCRGCTGTFSSRPTYRHTNGRRSPRRSQHSLHMAGVVGVRPKILYPRATGTIDTKMTALAACRRSKLRPPLGYYLQPGADLLTLHRADGSMVAAFAAGAALLKVVWTAKEDYREDRQRGA